MRAHPQHSSMTWASAQGIATLPLTIVGFVTTIACFSATGDTQFTSETLCLGPQPMRYLALMLVIGLCASWLGTLLWNVASKNTPTALTGQLIAFETLAALGYAYAAYQRWPSARKTAGIALLVLGVIVGMRALSVRAAGLADSNAPN